ncbi:hypothetical protein BH11PSE4_BH11PSE4_25250 [soil metagenome]
MDDPAKILVIDDSEDDRLLYSRALKKSADFSYVITEAVSGEDGLVSVDQQAFACVLLDYSLPGRNGVEILKRIRAKHPFVPVVMLTGLGNEKIAVVAMLEGAQNYICKANIDSQTLVHAIQVAMQHCKMQSRIADQQQAIQVFARALAHDLKEPVRTIRTLLDILSPELSPEEPTNNHLQSIRDAAERMNALIDTVYFYTRLDGNSPVMRDICGADALIDAAKKNISHLVGERQAVIRYSTLPQLSANSEQLVQVFQNLFSNAIQNCTATPQIAIRAEESADRWLFRISDNGTGIASEDADKLFMPFKRMSHHKLQGPGLGLATCRKIVELHGGKIWFESRPTGTDFIFSVAKGSPLVAAPRVAAAPVSATKQSGGAGREAATLLLVDDDDMAIELAQIQLIDANRLHCNVIIAHDGYEALARLHDTRVDLVVLDINMPRMDGFELLARMREEKLLESIAVVMCSTSTYQDDISKARELGACGYLAKPPDLGRLRSILQDSTNLEIFESADGLHLLRSA